LSEGGYAVGRNLTIEFRFAQDRPDRLPGLAADLIKHQVQLIVTSGGEVAARAAMAATSTVPIIATFGGDPVESGFVVSINRPGRNVTGVSLFNVELVAKQLEMLHQALPGVMEVSVLANGTNPNTKRMLRAAEAAAPALGVNLLTFAAATDSEIDNAFAALSQQPASALVVLPDPLFNAKRRQLVALATQHRIPTMFFRREFPLVGGLMSYASDQVDANSPTSCTSWRR
jgi:putative tryptophan/tyrosine transport system substrate-binding protein